MKPYADVVKDDRAHAVRASRCGPLAVTASTGRRRSPDYRTWSVEELRALARQLQLPGAGDKSRSELLRLFEASAA